MPIIKRQIVVKEPLFALRLVELSFYLFVNSTARAGAF